MSRQWVVRSTAVGLGGLLLGAPLLTSGTASAGQMVESVGRQVTFEGGTWRSLSCLSTPDVEAMTVPAPSTVRVVNLTGYPALLVLSGRAKGVVPDNGSTDVFFRHGTTELQLDPNCPNGADVGSVRITATPSPMASEPEPVPVRSTTAAVPGTTDWPSVSVPAVAPETSAHAAHRPPHVRKPHRPPVKRSKATRARAGLRLRTKSTSGTTRPQSTITELPSGEPSAGAGVPMLDLSPAITTVPAPAAASLPMSAPVPAAEPVAAMGPIGPQLPVGLLGLIASVCVLGVGTGLIRAFVAQRASRTPIA